MQWPEDSGPLRTLRDAGVHTGDTPPPWLRRAHTFTDNGHDIYLSHPAFLTAPDLDQLGALARDGYDIAAYPKSDGRIRVVIRSETGA